MKTKILYTHVLSPLHAGTGQGIGVIDLPIVREKATGLPFLPGSSVKGSLRDVCNDKDMRKKLFGPDKKEGPEEHAGSVQFSDQRLLLLPVRSLKGTFAWVTSPYVLKRFARDARDANADALVKAVPIPLSNEATQECFVIDGNRLEMGGKVYLEDLDLSVSNDKAKAREWADILASEIFAEDWRDLFKQRFCIVPDDVLNFLLETATEITARIALNENSKTVDSESGALWYEEALPCETVLFGLLLAIRIGRVNLDPKDALTEVGKLMNQPIQFGGKATVGRGLCRLRLSQKGTN
ncbi:MAG: type III-B CRISPR module RAMP protein Cmr4 [Blastocatellia bacterium]